MPGKFNEYIFQIRWADEDAACGFLLSGKLCRRFFFAKEAVLPAIFTIPFHREFAQLLLEIRRGV